MMLTICGKPHVTAKKHLKTVLIKQFTTKVNVAKLHRGRKYNEEIVAWKEVEELCSYILKLSIDIQEIDDE